MECVDSGVSGMAPDAVDKASYLPEEDINSLTAGRAPAGVGWELGRSGFLAFLCRFRVLICVTSIPYNPCFSEMRHEFTQTPPTLPTLAKPCTRYWLMVCCLDLGNGNAALQNSSELMFRVETAFF